jgi:hypothetical protein
LAVGSLEDAIRRSCVETRDKIGPLSAGAQHNWQGYGIRAPSV